MVQLMLSCNEIHPEKTKPLLIIQTITEMLRLQHRLPSWKGLKDYLVQLFLAKAWSRQDDPAPRHAKFYNCPELGIHCFSQEIILMADCSHCEKLYTPQKMG